MLLEEIKGLHFGNFYLQHSQPTDTALIYHDTTITYGELDRSIRQYATYLQQNGIQAGDIVALSCYNTPEFIYSYFAITRLGAIVVPLNLTLTMEEITYIIRNASTKAMFVHENILAKLHATPEQLKVALGLENVFVINPDTTATIAALEPVEMMEMNPDSTSTLLYTSGTTGKPKGAMLSHKNLMANTASCNRMLKLNSNDTFMCVLPMFHTFGFTTSVLLPLYAGAAIVIHEAFHPKEIMQSLVQNRVTVFCGVPAMYVVLAQALRSGNAEFPDLRLAVCGGSPMPVEVLNLFNRQYNIPLVEGYGLTEASPVVSLNPLDGEKKPGSIGKPLPGVEVRIVDEKGNELAENQDGELLVKGPNVMQGYYNMPEATAETIVDGWLHTGDIAYKDHEGYIFIVDRKKDMIITRGLNVYPREIEEILYRHPGVLEAAVIGVPDAVKGEVVKAFIVPKEGETLDRRMILDFLKPHLANYKMPRFVEITDSLPKNATGKVMKKALRNLPH
ncbi:long-chain-fatty-acid--CoA ligase [Aneurinibacillus danicus]|uniref:Long-chain-fatty-acid--CoA ligase n=3 Tax=Aneurinibacillus TaxID=55079 RepID=A0A511VCW3_9BACL|nr:long-chain fatty acid--CoA ligase [Aneurinibacillus danicus]GEN35403.1 long-chain-fatty-acid--CoA ligase [Aneurinibacillus danicus]